MAGRCKELTISFSCEMTLTLMVRGIDVQVVNGNSTEHGNKTH